MFELVGNYIYLRPSDISYSRNEISFEANNHYGVKETLAEIVTHVIRRSYSPNDVARRITVVRRDDRRGNNFRKKTYDNDNNCPGWWCVEGNRYLWALKSLEKIGVVKSIKVNCMKSIAEEHWEEIWSDIKIEKERTDSMVSLTEKQLEMELQTIVRDYKKYLKPEWNNVRSQSEETNCLRLEDYISFTGSARNTHSCIGRGICFSPVYDLGEDPNTDINHRCQRPYCNMMRQYNREHSHAFMEIFEWKLYLFLLFFVGSLLIVGYSFLKGCTGRIEDIEINEDV